MNDVGATAAQMGSAFDVRGQMAHLITFQAMKMITSVGSMAPEETLNVSVDALPVPEPASSTAAMGSPATAIAGDGDYDSFGGCIFGLGIGGALAGTQVANGQKQGTEANPLR